MPASLEDDVVEEAGDLAAVGDGEPEGDDSESRAGGLRRSLLILAGSTTRVSAGIAETAAKCTKSRWALVAAATAEAMVVQLLLLLLVVALGTTTS